MKNKLITFLVIIFTAFITVNTFAFQNTVDSSLNEAYLLGTWEEPAEYYDDPNGGGLIKRTFETTYNKDHTFYRSYVAHSSDDSHRGLQVEIGTWSLSGDILHMTVDEVKLGSCVYSDCSWYSIFNYNYTDTFKIKTLNENTLVYAFLYSDEDYDDPLPEPGTLIYTFKKVHD